LKRPFTTVLHITASPLKSLRPIRKLHSRSTFLLNSLKKQTSQLDTTQQTIQNGNLVTRDLARNSKQFRGLV